MSRVQRYCLIAVPWFVVWWFVSMMVQGPVPFTLMMLTPVLGVAAASEKGGLLIESARLPRWLNLKYLSPQKELILAISEHEALSVEFIVEAWVTGTLNHPTECPYCAPALRAVMLAEIRLDAARRVDRLMNKAAGLDHDN